MTRELIFSVTRKDFKITTFKASGNGGQHRDKTDSAVRIYHPESGASAESKDSRSQAENRKIAFRRLLATPRWMSWFRLRTAEATMTAEEKQARERELELAIRHQMVSDNLQVEVRDELGNWITVQDIHH